MQSPICTGCARCCSTGNWSLGLTRSRRSSPTPPPEPTTSCAGSTGCCGSGAPATRRCLRRAGEPATGTVAMDLAEAHRQHISRWFYDCDYEMHRGLADIYTSDDRYIAAYDEIEPGLALYVRDAMYANADRGQGRDAAQGG